MLLAKNPRVLKLLTRGFVVLALYAAHPAAARAQSSTQDQINQAVALYKDFKVEAARPILLRIISPGYLQQVNAQQKSTAFKYLGASYAVLSSPDSAMAFFTAALDFDPFTDLDPTEFSPTELAAFNEAKSRIFKIGIKPMRFPYLIIPQSQADSASYMFRLITTQRANIEVRLVTADSSVREDLYKGVSEGARSIPWKGLLSNGAFAPPKVYTLVVTGTSPPPANTKLTEVMNFRIEHVFETLEDTLPILDPVRDLLPERIKPSAPWMDLAKGAALVTAAIALPTFALDKGKIDYMAHSAAAAGVGLVSAGISFLYRRNNPQIPEAVTENARRRRLREAFNAGVEQRNRERLARTLIIISPIAGFSQ